MSAIAFAIGVIIVVIGGKQDANLVDVEEKSNTMLVEFDFIKKLKDIRVFFKDSLVFELKRSLKNTFSLILFGKQLRRD